MFSRDQSCNKSPIKDVVKSSEDWKEFAFDYNCEDIHSSLEEFQVTLKIDTSKVSSLVLALYPYHALLHCCNHNWVHECDYWCMIFLFPSFHFYESMC